MGLPQLTLFQFSPLRSILKSSRNLVTHVQASSTLRTRDNIIFSPYPEVSIPDATLPELLWERTSQWSNHFAVECSVTGKKLTYHQLRDSARRLGNSLLKIGFKKGDTIAVLLSNVVEYPVIILGVLGAGLILTPLHPLSTPQEISRQIESSQACCLFISPTFLNQIDSKTKKLLKIICVPENSHTATHFKTFDDLLKDDSQECLNRQQRDRDLNQTTLLMYTSGTTGLPKGVMVNHRNLACQALIHTVPEVSVVPEATSSWQATVFCIPPMSTIYSLGCIMAKTFYNGGKLLMVPSFRPDLFLSSLERYKEVVLHVVPTVINFLASSDTVKEKHLKNVICTVIGGAKPDVNEVDRLLKKRFHNVAIGYGMTEAAPGLAHSPVINTNYSSIGFVVSNTKAKVVDPDTRQIKGLGELGELCFKGPQITNGYLNQPEATKETFDEEGWLYTGDEGYFDESGRGYITDRIKDLIKVKGFQVAPAELELILKQHPSVHEACVISVPDPRTGEQPVAFVVPSNRSTSKIEDIREFVNSKVAPHKRLLTVKLIQSIPKTSSGKLKRRDLKKFL